MHKWNGASAADVAGNPTVLLFFTATIICTCGVAGYYSGFLGDCMVVTVNSLGLYIGFTVLHDAVHGVAHKRAWVERILGTLTGFFLTFTYPFFRGVHMCHHTHTNNRALDPDAVLGQLPSWLAPWLGGMSIYISYHTSFFRRHLWRSRKELIEVIICDAVYLGILVVAIEGEWLGELMVLWILPLLIALHFLVFIFDFLPHYPYDSTERLYSARAYGGRLIALIHLNQNYHLIHHIWPGIPWFRYRRAYLETLPMLDALGCRVSWKPRPLLSSSRATEGKISRDLPG
jgi:beta-carotene hydroxylase